MKRVGVVFLGAVMLAALIGPVSFSVSGGRVALDSQIATAAKDPLGSGGPVCVAVPIFATAPQGACGAGQEEIPNDPASGGAIVFYLKLVLKLLAGLIGAIIILVLVIAGLQYILSAGDPARVKSAKGRIVNAMTALVLYMMMFAILNFLVPGGILT